MMKDNNYIVFYREISRKGGIDAIVVEIEYLSGVVGLMQDKILKIVWMDPDKDYSDLALPKLDISKYVKDIYAENDNTDWDVWSDSGDDEIPF